MFKILKDLHKKCFGYGSKWSEMRNKISDKIIDWQRAADQRQLEREHAARVKRRKQNMEKYGMPYTPDEYLRLLRR